MQFPRPRLPGFGLEPGLLWEVPRIVALSQVAEPPCPSFLLMHVAAIRNQRRKNIHGLWPAPPRLSLTPLTLVHSASARDDGVSSSIPNFFHSRRIPDSSISIL